MRISASWLRFAVAMLAITALGACQSSLNRSSDISWYAIGLGSAPLIACGGAADDPGIGPSIA